MIAFSKVHHFSSCLPLFEPNNLHFWTEAELAESNRVTVSKSKQASNKAAK